MSSARGGGNGAGQEQAVARHEAATSKVAQASVRAFWTPARMQRAPAVTPPTSPSCPPTTTVPAPYGTWVAETLYAPSSWVNSGDFNHDVGFRRRGRAGQSEPDRRGRLLPAAAKPCNGQDLWKCSGVAGRDSRGTADHRLPCSMTGGSSGGGWITGGVPNSVNSFGYKGEKDAMYGPYFGDVAQTVYSTAANS